MNKIKYIYLLLFISFFSCDDYLDVEPLGKVIPKTVEDFRGFLTSAYAISKTDKTLSTYRSDELYLSNNSTGVEYYKDIFIWNDKNPLPETTRFPYASFYRTIFYTNHIIDSENTMQGSATDKKQLVGEAYALRALQYFELINLYAKTYNASTANTDAGVPIVTEYDSEKNYPVQTVQKVYDLILSDISEAEKRIYIQLQEAGYNYRFSMLALKSFKATVYLYQQKWQEAINEAQKALSIKNSLMNLNADTSILPSEYNSVEAILALSVVSSLDISTNTTISSSLINAYNKTDDLRFKLYFNKNSDGRYNTVKNADLKYKCTFRIADLYLIIAEASAHLNEINTAKSTLLKFAKSRYTSTGLETYTLKINALSQKDLTTEILEERRREFAIEGKRWNDLRRTTQPRISKIFDGQRYVLEKNDTRYVIPFPTDATINNPNL